MVKVPHKVNLPRVVVAVGDPRGGNGLAALRVAADPMVRARCRLRLAGDLAMLTAAAEQAGLGVPLRRVALDESGEELPEAVAIIDRLKHPLAPRAPDEAGRAGERVVEDLDAALQAMLFRWADAAVVAPVDMEAVRAAGFHYDDLASLLRDWLRVDSSVTLSPVPGLRHPRLAEGVPGVVVVVCLEEQATEEALAQAMKESVELAATLVGAKA